LPGLVWAKKFRAVRERVKEAWMKAVVFDRYGAAEVMRWDEAPEPVPGPGELLVAVRAAGVNRADAIQRQGHYPPPPGASQILGLELAGEVVALGPGCSRFKQGDRVFGLVEGGAYAERCTLNEALAIATPPNWSDTFAAAVLEVFLTANETLCHLGGLEAGQEARCPHCHNGWQRLEGRALSRIGR
jgi:NADPH:quinone reductase-like Zn-dependent oxidoreductase